MPDERGAGSAAGARGPAVGGPGAGAVQPAAGPRARAAVGLPGEDGVRSAAEPLAGAEPEPTAVSAAYGPPAEGPGAEAGGLDVAPFVATRYADPARLAAYTAPAYDLIEPAERARLTSADPRSIVHLTLPTFGPDDAAARLAAWRADGTLAVDRVPAFYVYDLAGPGPQPSTRGWVGAVAFAPPPVVAPHEATMAVVVDDRRALRHATSADLEPVVLAHGGAPGPAAAMARRIVAERPPDADLTDDTGVRHRLWRVADPAEIAAVRADFAARHAVIADGHHRWNAAFGPGGPAHATEGDVEGAALMHDPAPTYAAEDRLLALIVPAGEHGPQVRAIHRVVPDTSLGEIDVERFRATDMDPLTQAEAEELLAAATTSLVLLTDGDRWVRLTDPDTTTVTPAAWRPLDVALVDVLLVGGQRTIVLRHAVAAAVDEARRTTGVALLVRPTATTTVLEVAALGVLMPRKSTFFVPKPRTGLVLRCFADQV
jgi:uncharacterized protein (DUF1015 family)